MPLTPLFVEKATGDQAAPQVEEEHGGIAKNPNLTEYVNFVGRRLLKHSPRSDFQHTFRVLESPKIINAFALGNGNVYVTRGLLNILDDEAELAEIVGHEIGHVAHRHIGAKIDQAVGISSLMALAEGVYSSQKGGKISRGSQEMIETANQIMPALILNGFGRAQELESDASGLKYMVSAGYDPMGSVRVFQRFQKLEGEVPALDMFFRSHPLAKSRVSDLTKEISRKYPGVSGETYRDRYQSIVHGGGSFSDGIAGIPTPVAIGVAAALAIGVGVVIASL